MGETKDLFAGRDKLEGQAMSQSRLFDIVFIKLCDLSETVQRLELHRESVLTNSNECQACSDSFRVLGYFRLCSEGERNLIY